MSSPAPAPATTTLPGPVVLYDGLCGFCDASVQWLLDHDSAGALRYAALQGDTAASVRARHPELPEGLDSIVFVEPEGDGERVTWHSAAPIRIARHLPVPWRWLGAVWIVPAPLRDLGYRLFARFRYLVWGRREACRIPKPAERARFLP